MLGAAFRVCPLSFPDYVVVAIHDFGDDSHAWEKVDLFVIDVHLCRSKSDARGINEMALSLEIF